MPTRRIIILGSTGSIGTSTLQVIEHLNTRTSHHYEVIGLAGGSNASLLVRQARQFRVPNIAIAQPDEAQAADFRSAVPGAQVFAGEASALELVEACARAGDMVVAAMVGSAGLPAVVRAIELGCDIALANKETLVAAGSIVMPLAREHGVNILPVDSEHSAIFQCLAAGRGMNEVSRIVLTASGGPFRDRTAEQIRRATVDEALNHPTWNMGAKVTIDSATLMNKGLELIEAHHLFHVDADQLDAVIHPQSIVHSFVEFVDGSVIAQLSPPDMKLPIQYALTWPTRADGCANRTDWQTLGDLRFQPIDPERFPAVALAIDVIHRGGTSGAIFNAANEVAVAAFLDRAIPFSRIVEVVRETVAEVTPMPASTLEDIEQADAGAREIAERLIGLEAATASPRVRG